MSVNELLCNKIGKDIIDAFADFMWGNSNNLQITRSPSIKKQFVVGSILNKITYVNKNKFLKITDSSSKPIFDKEAYKTAKEKEIRLVNELLDKIRQSSEQEELIIKIFEYPQKILFRIFDEDKEIYMFMFTETMKVEYLFDSYILSKSEFNTGIVAFFNKLFNSYSNMENSLASFTNNEFVNRTTIDVNDKEELFEKKNKILDKLKQDLLLLFLFYKHQNIKLGDLDKFIRMYFNIFKIIVDIEPKNILEKETIKIYVTGFRYINILMCNFKFKNYKKYKKYCSSQIVKDKVISLCPNLQFTYNS